MQIGKYVSVILLECQPNIADISSHISVMLFVSALASYYYLTLLVKLYGDNTKVMKDKLRKVKVV